MGGAEFPPCWLFGLRRPSPGGHRLFGGTNGGLWEGSHQGALPRTFAASVLVPTVSHSHPLPLQETLQHQQVGLVQSRMGSLLPPPGSWCAHYPVCDLQEWSLCFPQSCQSPAIKSRQPSKPDSLGIPPPIAGPPGWEDWLGAQNPHSSGWTSVVCVLQFVSHPPSGYGIWFYCDCAPPTISLWLLRCLWVWGIFSGEFQCLPANDCPAVSCDSGVLARGSECTSFYSATLNQSPSSSFLNLLCAPFKEHMVSSATPGGRWASVWVAGRGGDLPWCMEFRVLKPTSLQLWFMLKFSYVCNKDTTLFSRSWVLLFLSWSRIQVGNVNTRYQAPWKSSTR